jgi:peptidoglycan/LPS O-acetylase OafA/YrhL
MDNHNSNSLISRESSTAIKGLLMLMIVFGHTGMLTTDFASGERTFIWHWLYTFHVYVFLILPFIYGYSKKSHVSDKLIGGGKYIDIQQVKNDLKHNLIKIGVPYCWFFLFSAIVFVTVGGGQFDLKGMLYAFFFGNEPLMDKYIGFNFMWFLPAMLALTTLKSVYYNSNKTIKTIKIIIVSISIVLWVLAIFKVVSQYIVGMYVPFAISQAFYFIILGLVARFIIEKQWPKKILMPIVILLIGALTMLFYYRGEIHTIISLHTAIRLVMPILIFLFLYGIRDLLAKSRILIFLGTYSLQIYLVHVFVINALVMLFTHFAVQSIGLGFVIYVLALGISCGLALVMVKVPFIKKMIFPNEK